jgi:hypothetical protein
MRKLWKERKVKKVREKRYPRVLRCLRLAHHISLPHPSFSSDNVWDFPDEDCCDKY